MTENPLCQCGHGHLSTRSPCDSFHVCGCRSYRQDLDDPASVAERRRVLLDATEVGRRAAAARTRRRQRTSNDDEVR